MSVTRTYTVHCDSCDEAVRGTEHLTDLRSLLWTQGWRRLDRKDHCPSCAGSDGVTEQPESESWLPIPNCPHFEVSDAGRVRNSLSGRMRVPRLNKYKYLQLSLSIEGRRTTLSVHGLVMAAFVGPRPSGYQINHKNYLKHDNRLENLEYVTPLENMRHRHRFLAAEVGNG